ncbi:hypothetical protein ACIBCN_41260 [Nocardia sp. NPDC051052]|uniref:hypothetical protein n=1 Tax=Nocardia sp. NPDC051052 TaxID=3364322 RepID=UPI00379CBDB9
MSTADFYQHPAVAYIPLQQAPVVISSLIWRASRRPEVDAFVDHARRTVRPLPEIVSAPTTPRAGRSALTPVCG